MRFWVFVVLTSVVFFIIIESLQIPPAVFFAAIPVFFIFGLYAITTYSFKQYTEMKPVPSKGYNARLTEMDKKVEKFTQLGFRVIDQFYLKTIPDSISYVLKHDEKPVFFLMHHFGTKMFFEFFTQYCDEFGLTTTDSVSSGMIPPRPKKFMQIFPGKTYKYLLEQHEESHHYLQGKGLRPYDIHESDFRHYYVDALKKNIDFLRKSPSWIIKITFWFFTLHGRKYCKSVMEQEASGLIKIYGQSV